MWLWTLKIFKQTQQRTKNKNPPDNTVYDDAKAHTFWKSSLLDSSAWFFISFKHDGN